MDAIATLRCRHCVPSRLLSSSLPRPRARANGRELQGADGFTLQGTFHSAEKGGPGILLLHQCNADRRIYDQLAQMLNTAGYNVLSFDFRGFGGSKGGEYTGLQRRASEDRRANARRRRCRAGVPHRARHGQQPRARRGGRQLRREPGGPGEPPASGGQDDRAALRRHRRGRRGAHQDSTKIPIFGAASEEDTNAAASIQKIVGLSTHRTAAWRCSRTLVTPRRCLRSSPTSRPTS